MPTFVIYASWTDQGIRGVKDAPKRSKAARAMAKKLGVEVKQIYLTSGEFDLLIILDGDGDSHGDRSARQRPHPNRTRLAGGRIHQDDRRTAIIVFGEQNKARPPPAAAHREA